MPDDRTSDIEQTERPTRPRFQSICMVGLGYIGLPTAAMFASRKVKVTGVDVNPHAVEMINRGEVHIVEPDLDIAVRSAVQQGYLRAVGAPEPADAFLIAVPTPFKGDDRTPDLSYIEAAANSIAPVLKAGDLVVLESTSPVGATEDMARWLAEARPDLSFPQDAGEDSDVRVAHCPERVLPGKVMQELISNDRIIGGMTARCSEDAADLYRTFVTGACVTASSPRAAELAKLVENSYRDVNIAFANELSLVSDRLDVDVWELIALANRHPRVNILQPGPGVGGHCIAVDPWFIVASAPEEARLIRTAREVNDSKPAAVLARVCDAIKAHLAESPGAEPADVRLAIYGLSFKPDIDDLRESPALAIVRRIAAEHPGLIAIMEPNIEALPEGLQGRNVILARQARADVHIMLVDHAAFKLLPRPDGRIVDTRGVWQ